MDRTTIALPKHVHQLLRIIAATKDISLSEAVTQAITQYAEREGNSQIFKSIKTAGKLSA